MNKHSTTHPSLQACNGGPPKTTDTPFNRQLDTEPLTLREIIDLLYCNHGVDPEDATAAVRLAFEYGWDAGWNECSHCFDQRKREGLDG